MTHEIIAKLADELAQPLVRECQVLYIMVEIRKYHEVEKRTAPLALRLYCNWVAHSKLSHSWVGEIVERIDKVIGLTKTEFIGTTDATLHEADFKAAVETLSLNELRLALKAFFQNEGLNASLCDDRQWWEHFVELYMSIVRECPILLTSSTTTATHIDAIMLKESGTVTAISMRMPDGSMQKAVPIEWQLFKDGKHLQTLAWALPIEFK